MRTDPLGPGPLGSDPFGPGPKGSDPFGPGPKGSDPFGPGPKGSDSRSYGVDPIGPDPLGPSFLGSLLKLNSRAQGIDIPGRKDRAGPKGSSAGPKGSGAGLHPPKSRFSRMDLQTPTPAGTGSGKLEDWKTGRLEDRMIGYWGFRLYIVHATVPSGTVADIILHYHSFVHNIL